jgi:hypothetical protein
MYCLIQQGKKHAALIIANLVPSSPILFNQLMEAIGLEN